MNVPTKVFLVLLQLAIGWHFLYEGAWKIRDEKKWSSKNYLQAANGPVAPAMRWTAGDPAVTRDGVDFTVANPVVEVESYFMVKPIDKTVGPLNRRLHKHMPPALEKEWDGYFQAFLKHYELDRAPAPTPAEIEKLPPEFVAVLGCDPMAGSAAIIPWGALQVSWVPEAWLYDPSKPPDPRAQRLLAERRYLQLKGDTVAWLIEGKKKVKRPHIAGPASDTPVPIQQRVQEYNAADQRARELAATKASMFGDKGTPELKKAREEAAALRAELLADIKDQTNHMKLALRDVLSSDQKRIGVAGLEPPPEKHEWARVKTVDIGVRWGLAIIGGCLLLGLFTRLACVAGAAFLLSFYLAMPAFPWLPEPALSEGHYLFVNKNIIEMLALLAIACSKPGRRYGLDILLRPLFAGVRRIFRKQENLTKLEENRVIAVKVPIEVPEPSNRLITEPSTRSDTSHAS